MSSGWSWFIIIITVANIAGAWWLLLHYSKRKGTSADGNSSEDTGHVWDGDLREYNNPLPRWWMGMFVVTVIFAVVYLILYPGLGSFGGALAWSQQKQYQQQLEQAEARYADIFDTYLQRSIPALADDKTAMTTGQRLYINNCATCHGSDARGATGFPNLRDSEWLYGAAPDTIKQSITYGRTGIMPGWGAVLDDAKVQTVVAYVQQLSGQAFDIDQAKAGQQHYQTLCVACHGPDGKGNPLFGAPDLTNNIWLYGGDIASLSETISKGRNGKMPAHQSRLNPARIHVLAAYVYSLGRRDDHD